MNHRKPESTRSGLLIESDFLRQGVIVAENAAMFIAHEQFGV